MKKQIALSLYLSEQIKLEQVMDTVLEMVPFPFFKVQGSKNGVYFLSFGLLIVTVKLQRSLLKYCFGLLKIRKKRCYRLVSKYRILKIWPGRRVGIEEFFKDINFVPGSSTGYHNLSY